MNGFIQFYRWLLGEPFTWIMYSFIQPLRFRGEIEIQGWHKRFVRMCRLALPLFLCSYPITLAVRLFLSFSYTRVYGYYSATGFTFDNAYLLPLFFDATWALLLALVVVVVLAPFFSLSYGIAGALSACFWCGVAVHTYLGTPGYLALACTVVLVLGFILGVVIGSARDIANSRRVSVGLGSSIGMLVGFPLGFLPGLGASYEGGVWMYHHRIFPHVLQSIAGSVLGAILGALFGVIVAGIPVGIIRGILKTKVFENGIERGFFVGTATCIAVSVVVGGVMGTAFGGYGEVEGLSIGLTHYILPNLLVVPFFILCYTMGYYRLPLYPWSALSSMKTYMNSQYQPLQVFDYLLRSSLYWDEAVFLPLPGLKGTLYHAIECDIERTLEIVFFVVAERSSQMNEVRPVAREIAMRDLEERETIDQIAHAYERLAKIIPQEAMLIDPRWQLPFTRLEDASREATRYCTSLGRQARRDALDQMILNLKRVPVQRASEDRILNERLLTVVNRWLAIARQELQKLEYAPDEVGNIDNPYICGPALQPNTSQFVGRRDLVQQLERALNKGIYRPSFFLTGERRMGKTSTLNQLPKLLGARYMPLTLDLQSRGMTTNIATFLGTIAEAIHAAMSVRGMNVTKLSYAALNGARRENEAAVYHRFDNWLKLVEEVLEQEERTILLAFDEFEKLEDVGRADYLDLHLLLDWFRSVIQHRTHLALLFSGVKTLSEMATNWSGYFVNVQTLRVSFLRPIDAIRLITQPTNNYPGEDIFAQGVVEEIMKVTGNHPFLIQAICSELIVLLNAELRNQATVEDVAKAMEAVFEHWWDTYFVDLWRRTSTTQRVCLQVLQHLGKATLQEVVMSSSLEERTTQEALQALRKRDLVLLRGDCYQIAAPVYYRWVERNQYNYQF